MRGRIMAKGPGGRPTDYSEELVNSLCSQIALGNSLRKICEAEDMPCIATIYVWFQKHPGFIEQYARAKGDSGDSDADKIEEIAEKVLSGVYEPAAARVAIDAFKWTASKKIPKKYGDRQHIEHSGKIGLADLTNEELAKKLEDLESEE
jgi:hypothetical protein